MPCSAKRAAATTGSIHALNDAHCSAARNAARGERPQAVNRNFAGLGNTERVWRDRSALDALPVIAPEILVPEGYRAVILAPHADEKSLGLGGLIARLVALGRPMLLIAATDGPAAPAGAGRARPEPRLLDRQQEALRALRPTGRARLTVLRAGLREGELTSFEDDLEWRLRGLILPLDIVFATWRYDGHPDHEAVGRIAAGACAAMFAPLVEVPVWTWQWSFPGDRRIPWQRARRVFLDRTAQARKRLAMAEYLCAVKAAARADAAGTRDAARPVRLTRPYEIVFV